jgi:hypothetical protein
VNMRHLILPHNKNVTDLGIAIMHELKTINLAYNKMITNNGLLYKPNLEKVILKHNQKVYDDGFRDTTMLKVLDLGYNIHPRLSLSFLLHNKCLEELYIYRKRNIDVNIIKSLKHLRTLCMPNNPYIFKRHLVGLPKLSHIQTCNVYTNKQCDEPVARNPHWAVLYRHQPQSLAAEDYPFVV